MDGKRISLLWWVLLFIAGCLLFFLMYTLSAIPMGLDREMGFPLWLQAFLFLFGAACVLGVYALWWRWTEQGRAADLPMCRLAADTGIGIGVGILFFCLVTGTIALLGGYRVADITWNGDALVTSLFFFLVVAVGEEVLFRGIIFRMVDQRWGTEVALIVSALIFGFVHITNENATVWASVAIAVEAGILLAAAYKWSGTLWLPIGIHWAWNFVQGPVFGFAVSGNETQSLVQSVIDGPRWLTGGAFGAEASVPAFVFGLAFAVFFLFAKRRSARKKFDYLS